MEHVDAISRNVCELLLSKDCEGVVQLLQQGVLQPDQLITDAASGEKFRLLASAIERDWTLLAKYLITNGAELNRKTYGWTPLMLACQFGNHEILEALLSAGAGVNLTAGKGVGGGGETALMQAAQKGDLWAVQRLLHKGANPKLITPRNQSAAYFATAPNRCEAAADVVRELVAAGCPLLGNELHWPVYRRDVEMTKLLLKFGCPVNTPFTYSERNGPQKGETPLTTAIGFSPKDSPTIDAGGISPEEQRREIVVTLLSSGADPNLAGAKGWTPLMLAVWTRELGLAGLLLRAGAAPDYVPPESNIGSPEALAAKRKVEGFSELVQEVRTRQ